MQSADSSSRSVSLSSDEERCLTDAEHWSIALEAGDRRRTSNTLAIDCTPEGVLTVVARSRDISSDDAGDTDDDYHNDNDDGNDSQQDSSQADDEAATCCGGRMERKRATLLCMMLLVGLFCVGELVGGIWTGSLALLSDAFHMLSDFLSLVVAFIAVGLATRTRDAIKSYGWQRAEIVGALVNGVFLASACLFISLDAVQRLFIETPERLEQPVVVLIVGIAGLLVNLAGLGMFVPHLNCLAHAHAHSHSHSHGNHDDKGNDGHLNMHGVFLHVAGDALGSLIVIGVALCHLLTEPDAQWPAYTDPICSLLLAAVIARAAVPLIRRTTHILMQSVPNDVDLTHLKQQLEAIDNVDTVHALHVWQMSERRNVGSVHVRCTSADRFEQTCRAVKRVLHSANIHESAVQPEFGHQGRADNCHDERDCCRRSVRAK